MSKQRTIPAQSLGLHKHAKGVKALPDSPLNLAGLFRTGAGSLRYSGIVHGRPLAVYQHQYMVFAGTTTFPVIHTIYLAEVSPLWPKLSITKRSTFAQLARMLGWRNGLQLDDPRFNRAFKVTTEDDDFAIAMLTPQLQQFLLTKVGVNWHIDLGRFALIYSGKLKHKRLAASVDRLTRFLELIPDELEAWQ